MAGGAEARRSPPSILRLGLCRRAIQRVEDRGVVVPELAAAQVRTGIDVLQDTRFSALRTLAAKHGGRLRLGILTNPVGIDSKGRRTIDVLRQDAEAAVPGVEVVTLFSGEHGIDAALDRDTWLDADEARAFGLVDKVFESRPAGDEPGADAPKDAKE